MANLNPAGSALVYSSYYGGTASDSAAGIAVDVEGAAYVAGWTESSIPTTSGAFQTSPVGAVGDDNAFLLKISGSLVPTGGQIWQPGPAPFINLPWKSAPALTFVWTSVSGALDYHLKVTNCGTTTFWDQDEGLNTTSGSVPVALGMVCASLTTKFNSTSVTYNYKYDVVEFNLGPGKP